MGRTPPKPPLILRGKLRDHPAVRAWNAQQRREVEPPSITVLKEKTKSGVYRLDRAGPDGEDIIAKRCQPRTGEVERLVYEEYLPRLDLPVVRCHGWLEDAAAGAYWLFLEPAVGVEYSTDDAGHRALAGRWLGEAFACSLRGNAAARLPDRGPSHYRTLLRASRETIRRNLSNRHLLPDQSRVLASVVAHLEMLEARWPELEQWCEGMPRGLVQGDFAVKNVRVGEGRDGPALLVFDWELAGWGVPATDLAQDVGHTVSPDLDSFRAGLATALPSLDPDAARHAARCGRFFRILDGIDWECASFVDGAPQSYVVKPVSSLRIHDARLAQAARSAGWVH